MSDKIIPIDFGSYVYIEQHNYGTKNDMFLHKVINVLQSNTYVDVPVKIPRKETIHDKIVYVASCICCGVVETEVLRYRLEDITVLSVKRLQKP